MNLVKCENGHFYDKNRYDQCPHCSGGGERNDNVTVPVMHNAGNEALTTDLSGGSGSGSGAATVAQNISLQDAVKSAASAAPITSSRPASDELTVSFYKKALGTEPVVGWLVGVEGDHFGEDFRLKSGRNFIGRASDMDVVITKDTAVSRDKHAVIVYEPKGNVFLVMPGEAKELCYLNDDVVLTPKEIVVNDILTVGDTKLMFIPCCSPAFHWDRVKKEGN